MSCVSNDWKRKIIFSFIKEINNKRFNLACGNQMVVVEKCLKARKNIKTYHEFIDFTS